MSTLLGQPVNRVTGRGWASYEEIGGYHCRLYWSNKEEVGIKKGEGGWKRGRERTGRGRWKKMKGGGGGERRAGKER